jgi:DNA-binding protein HU-beta
MTKAEIVAEISSKTGLERADVSEAIEAFVKIVKGSLIKGENVYVRGFGSFVVKKRAAKIARNISKNTAVQIPEQFVPVFKPADIFVEKVKLANKLKEVA